MPTSDLFAHEYGEGTSDLSEQSSSNSPSHGNLVGGLLNDTWCHARTKNSPHRCQDTMETVASICDLLKK
eukprot:12937720-Prorocentrum_lima.AAC.1